MKKIIALVVLIGVVSALHVNAAERATKAEAEAVVKKAIAFIKEKGIEKGYAEVSNKTGQFVDRDLYVVVYDSTGACLAHGANAKLIGKNLMEMPDADGKLFVKERVEFAKEKASFWQDYKFMDPLTKTIEKKQSYCEKMGEAIVCAGVYL